MLHFSSTFFFLFSVCLGFLLTSVQGSSSSDDATQFDFETLSLSSLKLLGDAHLKNGSVRLSRDLPVPNSGAGRALYNTPIRFRQSGGARSPFSFSTSFSFSVTNLNPSSIGGGLAFIISSDDQSIGDAGGYLGLVNETGADSSVIAVEFDTLMDVQFKDINGNHVGLDLNSLVSTQVADLDGVGVDLKSGNLVNAWIDYDGTNQILNVSVSYSNIRPPSPLLSINLDLDSFVDDLMFVGFSGSTQGSTEIHSLEWWSFSSSMSGLPSSMPAPQRPPLPPPAAGISNLPPPSPAPSGSPSVPQNTQKIGKSTCHNRLCKQGAGAVAGVATAGAFFLAIFACLLIWLFSKRFKSLKKSESLASEIVRTPREFSYKELKYATREFNPSRIIGHGAFGTVYKGILAETGAIVAVKRCSHNGGQGKAEFLSELSIIGSLRHRNLVRLQGWCHEKGEILLVYEFMPNGSLDKVLFESRIPLLWAHRRKILMGVASALAYLHQECENQVIHRDVKASNVMLDEWFNAKLGDFGLAKQIEHDKSPDATVTAGTMGYLAPEYLQTGRASEKTDVFSFGAVVLEVACGRRPIEKEVRVGGSSKGSSNLVEWVWSLHREGRLLEAADMRLEGQFEEGEMTKVLLVGLLCSHPDPLARPTMRNVVQILGGEAALPSVPRSKPSLSFSTNHLLLSLQDSVSDCNGMITISTSSSGSSFIGGRG
ncbi:L-type lectin-domain containing receptor kinase VIII.1 [Magnolia sinica]|uniref:L-type lectin-domain containing receptor kinase VIII.1 n=1 Tax=Magnolia sinica TaxID=86752 RepID=UPI0026597DD1|nr:L-type lectin-domain containing receptor kinase VIII.1 [Magnolia sinica]